MLDEKTKGQETTISPSGTQQGGKVVDIMEALKRHRLPLCPAPR
jgi:hypothetical protein